MEPERRRVRRGERPRALIVDDHVDSCELYETALNMVGFDIVCATDAPTAIAAATSGGADVVVVDLGLPGIDGWQLIDMLKRDSRTASMPVVVLTGQALPEVEARARALGCAAYFAKPCLPFDLAQTLRAVIYRPTAASR